jgi:hypothetical protein
MDSLTILAIIVLVIAILILIHYYLKSTNNKVYADMHTKASGLTSKVGTEEYINNFSDKMNNMGKKVKNQVQDNNNTDKMSSKINQFLDEQSEQVIADWDLTTHKDLDSVIERYENLEKDLDNYKSSNDKRVTTLEENFDTLEEKINKIDITLNNDSEEENKKSKVKNDKIEKQSKDNIKINDNISFTQSLRNEGLID